VTGVLVRRCLRVYDADRRFAPVFDDADRRVLDCDTVLIAAGRPPIFVPSDGGSDVAEFRPGWPQVDPVTLSTTAPGVFVAGDLAHGTRLLIDAVASGKKAARSIYAHVTGRRLAPRRSSASRSRPLPARARLRADPPDRDPGPAAGGAVQTPGAQVEIGYDAADARLEASRCLDCGVTPVFDGTAASCAADAWTSVDNLPQAGRARRARAVPSSPRSSSACSVRRRSRAHSAILKDEDRCIRCALCAMRCPADAITMERVQFTTQWRSHEYARAGVAGPGGSPLPPRSRAHAAPRLPRARGDRFRLLALGFAALGMLRLPRRRSFPLRRAASA